MNCATTFPCSAARWNAVPLRAPIDRTRRCRCRPAFPRPSGAPPAPPRAPPAHFAPGGPTAPGAPTGRSSCSGPAIRTPNTHFARAGLCRRVCLQIRRAAPPLHCPGRLRRSRRRGPDPHHDYAHAHPMRCLPAPRFDTVQQVPRVWTTLTRVMLCPRVSRRIPRQFSMWLVRDRPRSVRSGISPA